MGMPLIVVVEDEEHIAEGLVFNLKAEGYRTHHEADGEAALAWLLTASEPVGAILLDVMLPGRDGFSIVHALREAKQYTPVLLLTARGRPEDVMEGLEAGADDYITKPFELSMLLVRLKGLLRRMTWHAPAEGAHPDGTKAEAEPPRDEYRFNGRTICFDTLEVLALGKTIRLTLMEADLLRYLVEREGKIISRKEILEQVWRVHEDTDTRAIDNFIVRLRKYIEDDPGKPAHLLTIRGVGYRFMANSRS